MYGPRPGCLPALRGTDKQKKKGGGGEKGRHWSVGRLCLFSPLLFDCQSPGWHFTFTEDRLSEMTMHAWHAPKEWKVCSHLSPGRYPRIGSTRLQTRDRSRCEDEIEERSDEVA